MILFSEAMFMISFECCIHNGRYIENTAMDECVLAVNFANEFKIAKFVKLEEL